MILVTGATGTVGGEVARSLTARGERVRVLVRDGAKGAPFEQNGHEVAVGDFSDPASLDAALDGVDHVFLVCAAGPDQAELEGNVIDAAVRAGVDHLVKLSVAGADAGATVRFARIHAEVEEKLRASGLGYTLLQPNGFMQNSLAYAGSIAADGAFYATEGRVSWVDARDIGDAGAAALVDAGHQGETHVLTGPEGLTNADLAARLSEALGREVRYVEVTPEQAKESMLGMGFPEWTVDALVELFEDVYAKGYAADAASGVKDLTGNEPRTYAQFAADHREALAGG